MLGLEAATTLIEHLPPVGWADVATKNDVAALEKRIDDRFHGRNGLRFEAVENGPRAPFEHELRGQAITLFWAQVTVVMTMAALAFGLVRFT